MPRRCYRVLLSSKQKNFLTMAWRPSIRFSVWVRAAFVAEQQTPKRVGFGRRPILSRDGRRRPRPRRSNSEKPKKGERKPAEQGDLAEEAGQSDGAAGAKPQNGADDGNAPVIEGVVEGDDGVNREHQQEQV